MSWIFGQKQPHVETTQEPLRVLFDDIVSWNFKTFPGGPRTGAILQHLRDEIDEISAEPGELEEWADAFILLMAGAGRLGVSYDQIVSAISLKMQINKARQWPRPEDQDPNKPVKHVLPHPAPVGSSVLPYDPAAVTVSPAPFPSITTLELRSTYRPNPPSSVYVGAGLVGAAGAIYLAGPNSTRDEERRESTDAVSTTPVPVYDYAPPSDTGSFDSGGGE